MVGRRVLNSPDAFPDGRDRRHQRAGDKQQQIVISGFQAGRKVGSEISKVKVSHTHESTFLCKSYTDLLKLIFPGLGNFVPAVAHHFCLNWPAAFTQPGASTLAESVLPKSIAHIVGKLISFRNKCVPSMISLNITSSLHRTWRLIYSIHTV